MWSVLTRFQRGESYLKVTVMTPRKNLIYSPTVFNSSSNRVALTDIHYKSLPWISALFCTPHMTKHFSVTKDKLYSQSDQYLASGIFRISFVCRLLNVLYVGRIADHISCFTKPVMHKPHIQNQASYLLMHGFVRWQMSKGTPRHNCQLICEHFICVDFVKGMF